jgi:hypothetical protein
MSSDRFVIEKKVVENGALYVRYSDGTERTLDIGALCKDWHSMSRAMFYQRYGMDWPESLLGYPYSIGGGTELENRDESPSPSVSSSTRTLASFKPSVRPSSQGALPMPSPQRACRCGAPLRMCKRCAAAQVQCDNCGRVVPHACDSS